MSVSSPRVNAQIHGYVIVKKSHTIYRGVEREPWQAVRNAYSKGELSRDLIPWFEDLGNYDTVQLWGELSVALGPCIQFVQLAGSSDLEVLGVFSPYLERIGLPAMSEPTATFIGFDLRPVGDSSLLYELENKVTRMPAVLRERLNESGLVKMRSDMEMFVELYKKLADLDIVEPIEPWESIAPDQPCPMETVSVFSVDIAKYLETGD